MANFTSSVFQNEFLPDQGTDVHAIVSVTGTETGTAGSSGSEVGEIIIVDTSGSMIGPRIEMAKQAAQIACDMITDGTWFAIVAGTHQAYLAYPRVTSGPGLVQMNPQTRREAQRAIAAFRADGGTAIGRWLLLARQLFQSVGSLSGRHAILLTDGEDYNETPTQLDQAIRQCIGQFQADCRGIGVDWKVSEVRKIAQALLGSIDIIPDARDLPQVMAGLVHQAMNRGVANAQLRVWTPQDAQILFVRQVSPTVEDLTYRGQPINPLTQGYPTGAWGNETRDYHIAVRLPAKAVGQEQLAARVQLVVGSQILTQGLVKARWSDDPGLTAQIAPEVAHYTGQTELAAAIQSGLAARAAGDDHTATVRLGRAVQLAEATGNAEATTRLRRVVEVTDAATGTVRLRRDVNKADEMALDTASTKTTRIRN
ncbi:MAG: VWA domain-containing protein [Propionibacteriaceae bacterium]|jgi:hypothetical protein|nr:VWA domain-containing protein [Propionibacteriaceae bacterium]